MRYTMLIWGDEATVKTPAVVDEVEAWWEKWHAAGKVVRGGAKLDGPHSAKTISRGTDGEPVYGARVHQCRLLRPAEGGEVMDLIALAMLICGVVVIADTLIVTSHLNRLEKRMDILEDRMDGRDEP